MLKVLEAAESELGYLEKASNKNLDSKTENAGWNNYTKYWAALDSSLQGQPWCNAFVNWCFYKAYGATLAKKLLCTKNAWSYYTPTSASYFKNQGRWHTANPKVGDVIYFKNSERIHHVGIVRAVSDTTVTTIEGNTSSEAKVVANGGGVFKKTYLLTNSNIAGYGRPDYTQIDADRYSVGWNKDSTGWWYADTTKTYLKSEWKTINGCKYYFNDKGYAVKGLQTIDGKRYMFEDTSGAPKECAMMVTDADGAFVIYAE